MNYKWGIINFGLVNNSIFDNIFLCYGNSGYFLQIHQVKTLKLSQNLILSDFFSFFSFSGFAESKKAVSLHPLNRNGVIAQLVEQRTENPCVPGSIPGDATSKEVPQ